MSSFLQSLHLNNSHAPRTIRGFKQAQQPPLSHQQTQDSQLQQSYQDIEQNDQSAPTHKDIRSHAEQTLGSDNALIQAVKLPKDESLDEWLACHTVDFYNHINMLYGSITVFCSPQTCPRMIATQEYEYLWQDITSSDKKPVSLPAPNYIENLMNWIQSFFDNENIFPRENGIPFPNHFQSLIKTIFKRLFRVYSHIYCHHFDEISELGLQSILNTSLKHFVVFANEYNLINDKDYGPLEELVFTMLKK